MVFFFLLAFRQGLVIHIYWTDDERNPEQLKKQKFGLLVLRYFLKVNVVYFTVFLSSFLLQLLKTQITSDDITIIINGTYISLKYIKQ